MAGGRKAIEKKGETEEADQKALKGQKLSLIIIFNIVNEVNLW